MTVALDEPGHDEPAVEFDDLGIAADVRRNLFVAAHRSDLVAAYRYSFDITERVVDRRNDTAAQNQVGRLDRCFSSSGRLGRGVAATAGRDQEKGEQRQQGRAGRSRHGRSSQVRSWTGKSRTGV